MVLEDGVIDSDTTPTFTVILLLTPPHEKVKVTLEIWVVANVRIGIVIEVSPVAMAVVAGTDATAGLELNAVMLVATNAGPLRVTCAVARLPGTMVVEERSTREIPAIGDGVRRTDAIALLAGFVLLVAVMVTLDGDVTLEGAVYRPETLIEPMDGVMSHWKVPSNPIAVATNCCARPGPMVLEDGVIDSGTTPTFTVILLLTPPHEKVKVTLEIWVVANVRIGIAIEVSPVAMAVVAGTDATAGLELNAAMLVATNAGPLRVTCAVAWLPGATDGEETYSTRAIVICGGVRITDAVALFAEFSTLVAVIVNDCWVVIAAGGAYIPLADMVPTWGFTLHVTALFPFPPVTMAVICIGWPPPVVTTDPGRMLTFTGCAAERKIAGA
jgi:hypothetical protein